MAALTDNELAVVLLARQPGLTYRDVARITGGMLAAGSGTTAAGRVNRVPSIPIHTIGAGGGSIAVLYQNELHDWRASSQANPFFARLGVLFGKPRIA